MRECSEQSQQSIIAEALLDRSCQSSHVRASSPCNILDATLRAQQTKEQGCLSTQELLPHRQQVVPLFYCCRLSREEVEQAHPQPYLQPGSPPGGQRPSSSNAAFSSTLSLAYCAVNTYLCMALQSISESRCHAESLGEEHLSTADLQLHANKRMQTYMVYSSCAVVFYAMHTPRRKESVLKSSCMALINAMLCRSATHAAGTDSRQHTSHSAFSMVC